MNAPLRTALAVAAISGLSAAGGAHAGTFLDFFGNPTAIVHPSGYNGTGGILDVTVCLDSNALPLSGNPEQAIRNAIAEWNRGEGNVGNLQNVSNGQDFESVVLHELGHCVGLDHVALGPSETCDATPDVFDSPSLYFGASFGSPGPNVPACGGNTTVYSTNAGVDGHRGTRDDLRGGDVNRNWFRRNVNNPFELPPAVIDRTTYSVDLAHLPAGHNYVELATSFAPCGSGSSNTSQVRGQLPTQNVMFPVVCTNNTLRKLAPDDVVTLRVAHSGLDGIQGTADDYTPRLSYIGVASSCDIRISFVNNAGFALCQVSGTGLGGVQAAITTGNVRVQNSINWFYNQNDTTQMDTGPTLTPTPAHNSTTAMPAGNQGQTVTRNISFAVSGGSGAGSTQLACNGSGAVSVASGTPQTIAVNGSANPVVAQLTLNASMQNGAVTCTATRSGGGGVSNFTFNFTAQPGAEVCSGNCIFRNGFE